jgi:hypothetical protein
MSWISVEKNISDRPRMLVYNKALAVNAPIIGRWKSIRASILQSLPPITGHTPSVFVQKLDNRQATILISVWNPRDNIWIGYKLSSRNICRSHQIEANVNFLQAYDVFFVGGQELNHLPSTFNLKLMAYAVPVVTHPARHFGPS